MFRALSAIHIPAAFPKLAKKRRGFSLASGLENAPFYYLFLL
jgi:hypothetical protein